MLFAGNDGLLPVFHTGRSQRSSGKSDRIWSVFHVAGVRQEMVKSVNNKIVTVQVLMRKRGT